LSQNFDVTFLIL